MDSNEFTFGQNVLVKNSNLPRSACEGVVIKTSGGAPGSYKVMFRDGSAVWIYGSDLTTDFAPNTPAPDLAVRLAAAEHERDALLNAVERIKILADDPIDTTGYPGFAALISQICNDALTIVATLKGRQS